MSDWDILNELFHPKALIPIESYSDSKHKVVLREPDSPDSIIEIKNIPDDTIVINLDSKFSNNLFSKKKGCSKRADFILISVEKECVMFIELKRSNSSSETSIIQQLKGAYCAFKYCKCVVDDFFQETFLNDYKVRFVAFTRTDKKKRPTTEHRGVHDHPDKHLKVRGTQSIRFNKIAGLGAG